MKGIMGLAAVMISTVVMFGCAEDIVFPGVEPLIGEWAGTYTVTLTPTDELVHMDYVLFSFSETGFIWSPDPEKHIDGVCFCYGYGTYAINDGVRLAVTCSQPSGAIGCQSCNPEEDPDGTFTAVSLSNPLILKQQLDSTMKVLELQRVVPDDD